MNCFQIDIIHMLAGIKHITCNLNVMPESAVTGAVPHEPFALLTSAPMEAPRAVHHDQIAMSYLEHKVDNHEPWLMQTEVFMRIGEITRCAYVSALATFRDILLKNLGYAANLLHLVVIQIRDRFLSIDQMVSDCKDSTEGAVQVHLYQKKKGGIENDFIGATEGIEDDFPYIFQASLDRNSTVNATHSNAPVAEEETQDFPYFFPASQSRTQGNATHRNAPVAEEETQDFPYFFPAAQSRTQGNAPAAADSNVDNGASRQQNVPSRERIEALLHISPQLKNVRRAVPKKNSRKKRKDKRKKKGKKTQDSQLDTQPAPQKRFDWDPKLIFKDGIHLLSTGINIPIIEYRTRVLILTI